MSLRERMNQDSVCGLVVLLLVLVFWLQRDYNNPLVQYFPDSAMVVIAILAAILVVRGLLKPGSSEGFPEAPNYFRLLAAVGLLLAWVLLLSPLGYLISSILAFLAMSLFLRERPITAKNVAVDGAVSVVVVGFLYFIFTNVLIVTLPPVPFT